jgi:hypothetical protein
LKFYFYSLRQTKCHTIHYNYCSNPMDSFSHADKCMLSAVLGPEASGGSIEDVFGNLVLTEPRGQNCTNIDIEHDTAFTNLHNKENLCFDSKNGYNTDDEAECGEEDDNAEDDEDCTGLRRHGRNLRQGGGMARNSAFSSSSEIYSGMSKPQYKQKAQGLQARRTGPKGVLEDYKTSGIRNSIINSADSSPFFSQNQALRHGGGMCVTKSQPITSTSHICYPFFPFVHSFFPQHKQYLTRKFSRRNFRRWNRIGR